MKRFITVSLALFLGLISAASPTTNTTSTKTGNPSGDKFQVMVEDLSEDLQRLNCILYDDLTFFDIRGLEKFNPYTSTNVTASPNALTSYNFNFCRRFKL